MNVLQAKNKVLFGVTNDKNDQRNIRSLSKEVEKRSNIIFISPLFLSTKSHVVTDFETFFDFDSATFGLTVGTMDQELFLLFLKRQILLDSQSKVYETCTCMHVYAHMYEEIY
jgi:hypothetical protein